MNICVGVTIYLYLYHSNVLSLLTFSLFGLGIHFKMFEAIQSLQYGNIFCILLNIFLVKYVRNVLVMIFVL